MGDGTGLGFSVQARVANPANPPPTKTSTKIKIVFMLLFQLRAAAGLPQGEEGHLIDLENRLRLK